MSTCCCCLCLWSLDLKLPLDGKEEVSQLSLLRHYCSGTRRLLCLLIFPPMSPVSVCLSLLNTISISPFVSPAFTSSRWLLSFHSISLAAALSVSLTRSPPLSPSLCVHPSFSIPLFVTLEHWLLANCKLALNYSTILSSSVSLSLSLSAPLSLAQFLIP